LFSADKAEKGPKEPLNNYQRFFGGHKAVARPDPFPNSAVKHSLADGSACIACARVGCRQILSLKSRNIHLFRLFLFRYGWHESMSFRQFAPEPGEAQAEESVCRTPKIKPDEKSHALICL
jgi:hypothetical protein